jgi:molybdopterin-guanine dinucleotide biosynthesis protein A
MLLNGQNKDIVGVVLAGGKASRMGYAKERINYHGKENMYYLADLLKMYFDEVVISLPAVYNYQLDESYDYINDVSENIGPIEGIYRALLHSKDKAVFVAAVDLPAVTNRDIEVLLKHRDSNKSATLFTNPEGKFEPLFAIWESKNIGEIEKLIEKKDYGLQRYLRNVEVQIAPIENHKSLTNINRPEEREEFENNN